MPRISELKRAAVSLLGSFRFRHLLRTGFPSDVGIQNSQSSAWLADGPTIDGNRHTLDRILTKNIVPFWYPEVIDTNHGGYRLNHDLQGKWKGPANKSLVTQARTVWFFSRLVNSPYRKNDYLKAAAHGYEYLRERMWDRDFGGFYWEVESEGNRVAKPDKHLYGQAFGLYALVEYAKASNESSAGELASKLFDLLECHAHDAQHACYKEFLSREWSDMPAHSRSYLKTGANVKSMNTHLHLLEAVTSFFYFSRVPVVKERLTELIFVLSNTVVRQSIGACTDQHRKDWMPLVGDRNDRVCYGHDIENIWLLSEACNAAGMSNSLLMDLYRTLFAYALRYGFDRKQGGFFYAGPLRERADQSEKVWSVQAEGMLGALQMYGLTREKIYWDCFTQTLQWLVTHQIDWVYGDWHDRIHRHGRSAGDKAGAWKGPYHNGRAVLQCLELLGHLEKG
ncbi:MAG: AGE family epimerase/isomerase [Candidatus Binatia bacterium]